MEAPIRLTKSKLEKIIETNTRNRLISLNHTFATYQVTERKIRHPVKDGIAAVHNHLIHLLTYENQPKQPPSSPAIQHQRPCAKNIHLARSLSQITNPKTNRPERSNLAPEDNRLNQTACSHRERARNRWHTCGLCVCRPPPSSNASPRAFSARQMPREDDTPSMYISKRACEALISVGHLARQRA